MFNRNARIIFFLAAATSGLSAFAHEGHSHSPGQGNTPSHYMTEPFHLFQFAAIALSIFAVGWMAMKYCCSKGSNQAI